LKKLHDLVKDKPSIGMVSLDISSAFDSPLRHKLIKILIEELGNDAFLHTYFDLLNRLKLSIDLCWKVIEGIKSDTGIPQGFVFSSFC
jgi:hypothetical protein